MQYQAGEQAESRRDTLRIGETAQQKCGCHRRQQWPRAVKTELHGRVGIPEHDVLLAGGSKNNMSSGRQMSKA
jgi:hypothetical protein